ncbi:MAG: putative dsRNA-binding protein, partial [Patescibacteria group bacterium]
PKSRLQEMVQAKKGSAPVYRVLEEKGPAHLKTFKVGVFINGAIAGEGIGKSKQIAEENAAKEALSKLQS